MNILSVVKYISIYLLCTSSLIAQNQDFTVKQSSFYIGLQYSFGSERFFDWQPYDYEYSLHLIEVPIRYDLKVHNVWKIQLLGIPQFNLTRLKPNKISDECVNGHEFGLNLGISFNWLLDNFEPYILLSAGPHYVSDTPERQVAGFIFSDNFEFGSYFALSEKVQIGLNLGFRHISNASIKSPNGGVNSFIFGAGINYKLLREKPTI